MTWQQNWTSLLARPQTTELMMRFKSVSQPRRRVKTELTKTGESMVQICRGGSQQWGLSLGTSGEERKVARCQDDVWRRAKGQSVGKWAVFIQSGSLCNRSCYRRPPFHLLTFSEREVVPEKRCRDTIRAARGRITWRWTGRRKNCVALTVSRASTSTRACHEELSTTTLPSPPLPTPPSGPARPGRWPRCCFLAHGLAPFRAIMSSASGRDVLDCSTSPLNRHAQLRFYETFG